ncbi:hypothetical protein [Bremerella alba]|uniref:hypothetical protein n=1 Tax=Bremerella alba TaxID=980252 RepID=UPI001A9562B4|nr:hypothetical protein [Bremerella alba]
MNSEFTTIRSLIVLTFLVGLPVVAIMPEGVQGAIRGIWPEEQAASESPSLPVLQSSTGLSSFPLTAPAQHQPAAAPTLAPVTKLAEFQQPTMSSEPEFRPSQFEVPAEVVSHEERASAFATTPSNPIQDLPLPSDRLTAPSRQPSGLITQGTQDIQTELDNLGANYYRLESWGNSPRVYRFNCTVAIKIGQSDYSQRFEATAESSEAAMRQVHTDVQSWHERFSSLSLGSEFHESMNGPARP